jgi:uncharacterized protein (TIGR03382 family)
VATVGASLAQAETINVAFQASYTSRLRVGNASGGFDELDLVWPEVLWETMLILSEPTASDSYTTDTTCSMSGTITASRLFQSGGSGTTSPLYDASSVFIQHENHDLTGTAPENTYEILPDIDLYRPKSITFSFLSPAGEVLAAYRLDQLVTLQGTGPARFLQTEEPVTFEGVFPGGLALTPLSLAGGYTDAPPIFLDQTSATVRQIPAPGAAALLGLGGLVAVRRRR